MAQGRVIILNETRQKNNDGDWDLCFQYCRYEYGDEGKTEENGYRFIWRRPGGNLQGARGQARIPSIADVNELTAMALREGWGHHIASSSGFDQDN